MATLTDAVRVLQLVLLGAALPLSIIAARGYWHAPFGRVLRPLPVATVGFIVALSRRFIPVSTGVGDWIQLGGWTVAVVAVTVASVRFFLVTTEREVLT